MHSSIDSRTQSLSSLSLSSSPPSFSLAPMIQASRLENVLPACLYSPTYVVKDFPIARYQGLQFVSQPSSSVHVSVCMHKCVPACVPVYVGVRMSTYLGGTYPSRHFVSNPSWERRQTVTHCVRFCVWACLCLGVSIPCETC